MLASAIMGEVVWWFARHVGANAGDGSIPRALVGTVIGAGVYVAMLALLRVPELTLISDRLRRRHSEV